MLPTLWQFAARPSDPLWFMSKGFLSPLNDLPSFLFTPQYLLDVLFGVQCVPNRVPCTMYCFTPNKYMSLCEWFLTI